MQHFIGMRVISVPGVGVEPAVHQLFYFLFGSRDKTDLESTEFDVLAYFLSWFIFKFYTNFINRVITLLNIFLKF